MGGKPKVTDLLLNSVSAAADRNEIQVDALLGRVQEKHDICIDSLFSQSTHQKLKDQIKSDISDLRDILKTVSLMKWQTNRIRELVSGFGELWSSQILASLLSAQAQKRHDSTGTSSPNKLTHHFTYVDARRIITIDEDAIQDGAVCWDISQAKANEVYAQECAHLLPEGEDCLKHCLHMVITGYVASNTQGVATTLQRDGSDYSAAIMGRLLQSNNITKWTDVDGVLSADPRRVLGAHVIPEVSYKEAMELAYFGAKVIHPKMIQSAIMTHPQIPIYIRNTFNSSFHGTRIYTSSTTHTDRDKCVCGLPPTPTIQCNPTPQGYVPV